MLRQRPVERKGAANQFRHDGGRENDRIEVEQTVGTKATAFLRVHPEHPTNTGRVGGCLLHLAKRRLRLARVTPERLLATLRHRSATRLAAALLLRLLGSVTSCLDRRADVRRRFHPVGLRPRQFLFQSVAAAVASPAQFGREAPTRQVLTGKRRANLEVVRRRHGQGNAGGGYQMRHEGDDRQSGTPTVSHREPCPGRHSRRTRETNCQSHVQCNPRVVFDHFSANRDGHSGEAVGRFLRLSQNTSENTTVMPSNPTPR